MTTTPATSVYKPNRRRFGLLVHGLLAAAAALPLGGCAPATVLNAFVPSEGYELRSDLAYGSGERHGLDLYIPADTTAAPAPVIVYFYGGSWKNGSREHYRFIGEALARQGFLVAVPDYRLFPAVRFPAFVEDGAQTVRWVRDNIDSFGGDPGRIILMGHSAGAHIAALLVLDESYLADAGVSRNSLRGLVGVAGPYAFDPVTHKKTKDIFAGVAKPDRTRPITFAPEATANGGGVPALLLHGAEDTTVLPANSRALAEELRKAGSRATFREYAERGHIGIILSFAAPFRDRDSVYQDTIAFLKTL